MDIIPVMYKKSLYIKFKKLCIQNTQLVQSSDRPDNPSIYLPKSPISDNYQKFEI